VIGPTIVRPHRSITYDDAAYCYRQSSVVCRSVGLSITLSKTAKPIEMPFELWTRVTWAQGTIVLDWGPCEGAILKRKGAAHCKV